MRRFDAPRRQQFRAKIVLIKDKLLSEKCEWQRNQPKQIRRIGCVKHIEILFGPYPADDNETPHHRPPILQQIACNAPALPWLPVSVNPDTIDNLKRVLVVSRASRRNHRNIAALLAQRSRFLLDASVPRERHVFDQKDNPGSTYESLVSARCMQFGFSLCGLGR